MNDPNLDYDYPSSELKPVIEIRLRSHATQSNKLNDSFGLRLTPNNRYNLSNNQLNGQLKSSFTAGNFNQNKSNTTNLEYDLVNVPIPLRRNNQSNSKTYYDIPTNKPVKPQFSNQPLSSKPNLQKSPLNSTSNKPTNSIKPSIPQKSCAVLSKMSIYSKPSNVTSIGTVSNSASTLSTLNKQNTSKPLPLLPSERSDKPQPIATSKVIPSNSSGPNLYDTIKSYKYKDIYQEQDCYKLADDNDEDDDDGCDYEYDYVCLESKKKLDSEDEIIKMKIDKIMRPKYERMVLNSSNMKSNLDNMQLSLSNTTSLYNNNIRSQIFQRYRQIFRIALEGFENWTLLSIEIIKLNYPPDVFFNFIKHTLLSGQTLLCAIKSLHSHIKSNESNEPFSGFSAKFIENLRQIVLRSKKIAKDRTCSKLNDEIIDSIKGALKVVHEFDVVFSRLG